MDKLRTTWSGPWRAVFVLGVTQILAWGSLWYAPGLTIPLIASERGWTLGFAMAGFSAGLLVAGLSAPTIGRLIDSYGGHRVMACGSLGGALGLVALVVFAHPVTYFVTWMCLGVAIAASLYDAAFATLGRIFGSAARRPITITTFAGGFASTIGWPAALFLIEHGGWCTAYLTFAALLAFVAAPLHAFVLPRLRAERATIPLPAATEAVAPGKRADAGIWTFLLLAVAFAAYAFITSSLSTHMLPIFGRAGLDAATAVAIGALFGPAQVTARLCEFVFAGNMHPLAIARSAVLLALLAFAMLLSVGIAVPTAVAFAVMFGMSNGLITIARGTVPLAVFGPAGYGHLIGRLARPAMLMQSIAPVALAVVIERQSYVAALVVLAICAVISLTAFLLAHRREAAAV
jgi:MFS family permease